MSKNDLIAAVGGTAAASSEWEARGHLAASLTCWHRLTGEEADELVAMFQRRPTPATLQARKCAQCKKVYKHGHGSVGCPRCAPGVEIAEAEFQKPIAEPAAQQAEPADPLDWPLPCDVTVGHGTIGKGVALRTLVNRMKVLYEMATGNNADEVANRTPKQLDALQHAFLAQVAAAPAQRGDQQCQECGGSGVDGDVDNYGRTVDVLCGGCNGTGVAAKGGA
ncbi:hypothetical protein [Acidovorax sp. ACV01]|uniref:hypothetical protein n=1 Tax=Acidovorax sp. ACV01 TaxID=2769311 RepID=UPI00177D409B|nr:hypothetical protein [Acidovorax sp. ACV01]MBD9395576.1 hypothetical protein [Acidovorax sp. ACV01]